MAAGFLTVTPVKAGVQGSYHPLPPCGGELGWGVISGTLLRITALSAPSRISLSRALKREKGRRREAAAWGEGDPSPVLVIPSPSGGDDMKVAA
jgi:hypothetical protein